MQQQGQRTEGSEREEEKDEPMEVCGQWCGPLVCAAGGCTLPVWTNPSQVYMQELSPAEQQLCWHTSFCEQHTRLLVGVVGDLFQL